LQIRINDPSLLVELCDFLAREGFIAVESGPDTADVLTPYAASEFEAATLLLTKIDLWRATHPGVTVRTDA
jgi:hypothetical protein